MENKEFKQFLINTITLSFSITMIFGWIVYAIIFSSFEDTDLYIALLIYTISVLLIGSIWSAKDLIQEQKKSFERIKKDFEKYKIEENKILDSKKISMDSYFNEQKNIFNKTKNDFEIYRIGENKSLENKKRSIDSYFDTRKEELFKIINDEKATKPYLAEIYGNYEELLHIQIANYLKRKKIPALKASEYIKEIGKEKRELTKKLKIFEHQNSLYEKMFPWLEEFKEINEEEVEEILNITSEEEYERAKNYLSPKEYNELSQTEKYQIWLDRYKNRKNKTNWQIGIDYERFVGYRYEIKGYKILYNGALEGLEDMGRDLIATKDNTIIVIQCKNWSKDKVIHEKHIFQLYGTMILEKIKNPTKEIKGLFVCTNELSELAKEVAKELNIEVLENFKYDRDYPCIKCNISKKDFSKIYHLPFDQQYDRVDIDIKKRRMLCFNNRRS